MCFARFILAGTFSSLFRCTLVQDAFTRIDASDFSWVQDTLAKSLNLPTNRNEALGPFLEQGAGPATGHEPAPLPPQAPKQRKNKVLPVTTPATKTTEKTIWSGGAEGEEMQEIDTTPSGPTPHITIITTEDTHSTPGPSAKGPMLTPIASVNPFPSGHFPHAEAPDAVRWVNWPCHPFAD